MIFAWQAGHSRSSGAGGTARSFTSSAHAAPRVSSAAAEPPWAARRLVSTAAIATRRGWLCKGPRDGKGAHARRWAQPSGRRRRAAGVREGAARADERADGPCALGRHARRPSRIATTLTANAPARNRSRAVHTLRYPHGCIPLSRSAPGRTVRGAERSLPCGRPAGGGGFTDLAIALRLEGPSVVEPGAHGCRPVCRGHPPEMRRVVHGARCAPSRRLRPRASSVPRPTRSSSASLRRRCTGSCARWRR